jgi:carbon storage regulator
MLVLSRKVDQSIMVGDSITITVISIRDDVIRLGISAPPEVLILRQELREQREQDRLDREREGGPE